MDPSSGDLICTQCGAVLDNHMRDETAEWREYNNVEDIMRGNGPGKRGRCGEAVDESKWVGGLMPTKVSSTVFTGGAGFGGSGSGAGAGTSEEKYRLAQIRNRLKRTHNMIENMVEQEQKARYAEVVLEQKARDAQLERGEEGMLDETHGIEVQGDYEGLMLKRQAAQQDDEGPQPTSVRKVKRVSTSDQEQAFISLKDKKWSLPDAILLFGTLDQVQQWKPPSTSLEWTDDSLETERNAHTKKLDASSRSSLHKLYLAFTILEKAAQKLALNGRANQTFREAVSWLCKFVAKNDGLRIKGISSGSSSLSGMDLKECSLLLTLLGPEHHQAIGIGSSKSKSKSSSLTAELHRFKQYCSLGSAILYLSAKRTGVGRTLTEVCSAFGTYSVVCSNNSSTGKGGNDNEPLVRPKHCSRAMQELRTLLPEVVLPLTSGGLATTHDMAATLPTSTCDVPIEMDEDTKPPAKVSPNYDSARSSVSDSPVPVKSDYRPDTAQSSGMVSQEEAALADLTSRMANSLKLPPNAVSAAIAVAIQCAKDVRASSDKSPSKQPSNVGKSHIRPRQRRRVKGQSKTTESTPEIVAASSILLVCNAGGVMQRLARQALDRAAATSSSSSDDCKNNKPAMMSNALDDMKDDLSFAPISSSAAVPTAVAATRSDNKEAMQNTISSWTRWKNEPVWHRDVIVIEQCTGVPRKTIISYYSNAIHPRRSHFLGVARQRLEENSGSDTSMGRAALLHNIVAAVPLLSLRNL